MRVTTDYILRSLNYRIFITSLPGDETLQKNIKNVFAKSLDMAVYDGY
jgi:hypothetical protein